MYQLTQETHNQENRLIPIKNYSSKILIKLPSLTDLFPDLFQKTECNLLDSGDKILHYEASTDTSLRSQSASSEPRSYSFIALTENHLKPRPRRRYEQVKRLYTCTFPGCDRSYGALNHLNSHIVTKQHGPKRNSQEFCEMRRAIKSHSSYYNQQPY